MFNSLKEIKITSFINIVSLHGRKMIGRERLLSKIFELSSGDVMHLSEAHLMYIYKWEIKKLFFHLAPCLIWLLK